MVALIDGTKLAAGIVSRVAEDASAFRSRWGFSPGLAAVLVGNDPASEIYVARKVRQCRLAGLCSFEHKLDQGISQEQLLALIGKLNHQAEVHGILVQLPLPRHIDAKAVLDAIDPAKDVDGFHPVNVGRLSTTGKGLTPCTPLGCMRLLETVIEDFRGLHAVVIGKSNIVGKPMALLLLERECTVTVTHIYTKDLPRTARSADILVAAAGSARLVRGEWVKPGAVVIDVGINRSVENGRARIVGDVNQAEMDHAAAITPVPGGVGPMTIACLIENTMRAAMQASVQ